MATAGMETTMATAGMETTMTTAGMETTMATAGMETTGASHVPMGAIVMGATTRQQRWRECFHLLQPDHGYTVDHGSYCIHSKRRQRECFLLFVPHV